MARGNNEVTVGAAKLKPKRKRIWTKVMFSLILGILLGGGTVYYYYNYYTDKLNKKVDEPKVVSNQSEEEKQVDIHNYEIERLISALHFKDGSISEKTLYLEEKTLAQNLDSNYVDNLLLKEAFRTKSNFDTVVSIKDLEKARINLFGKNYEIIIPTDKEVGSCPVFNYDISNRTYSKSNTSCSLESDIEINYVTTKAIKKDKSYIQIYEAVCFIQDDEVFSKIDGSNNLSGKLEDIDIDKFDINDNIKNLNQYKFNFKYDADTDNYIFESIELVK